MTDKQQNALRPTTNEDSKLRLHDLTTEEMQQVLGGEGCGIHDEETQTCHEVACPKTGGYPKYYHPTY